MDTKVSYRRSDILDYCQQKGPLKKDEREIKGYPLLDGFRGAPKADIEANKSILMKISDFAINYPEVDQFDLNPVFTYPEGAKIVDARIILRD
jgi:acyl-CoA synthetase (NDP forming)